MGVAELITRVTPSRVSRATSSEDTLAYRKRFRYNSPLVQVILVTLVSFGTCGFYNSLQGAGGAGQLDTRPSRDGNIALHAVGAVFYLFVAPIVYDTLGARYTLFTGTIFYPLYASSLLAYNHIKSYAYVVSTSALLGVGSTFFWVAEGAIVTALPLDHERGRLLSVAWLFNVGGVIGGFIAMGLNWDSSSGTVSDATYIVFIALMAAGWLSSLLVTNVSNVVRTDGTRPHIKTDDERLSVKQKVKKSFISLLKILPRKESILMLPFFFMSNYFYSYQQNTINGRLFNIRTRSFNSAMYWFAQMVAAAAYGLLLDYKKWTRQKRGFVAYLVLFVLALIVWGGGLALQLRSPPSGDYYTVGASRRLDMIHGYRGTDGKGEGPGGTAYAGPFIQYFVYGAFDALWQNLSYWVIAALFAHEDPDDEDDLMARYVGLYKSICGVGQSIAWRVNSSITGSHSQDFNIEFGLNWGLVMFALVMLGPVFLWIKELPDQDVNDNSSDSKEDYEQLVKQIANVETRSTI